MLHLFLPCWVPQNDSNARNAEMLERGFWSHVTLTMKRGPHMEWIMGLWWRQLHSCPGMGGLFRALPLTFPCRCWDFWPLHHAVPCCLWVLLIVMEWSALACVCVLKMHFYRACVFRLYDLLRVCALFILWVLWSHSGLVQETRFDTSIVKITCVQTVIALQTIRTAITHF